jgi:hypothetical protein
MLKQTSYGILTCKPEQASRKNTKYGNAAHDIFCLRVLNRIKRFTALLIAANALNANQFI